MAHFALREDIYSGGPQNGLLRYWLASTITRDVGRIGPQASAEEGGGGERSGGWRGRKRKEDVWKVSVCRSVDLRRERESVCMCMCVMCVCVSCVWERERTRESAGGKKGRWQRKKRSDEESLRRREKRIEKRS